MIAADSRLPASATPFSRVSEDPPGKGFQTLARSRHVGHELFGQLSRKEMAEFLAQGNKMALAKAGKSGSILS